MKTKSKTINGWLKNRAEHMFSGGAKETFTDGILMPVIGEPKHKVPGGSSRAYLFSYYAARFAGCIDQNNVSRSRRGGRFYTVTPARHVLYCESVSVFIGRKMEWLRGPSDVVRKYILPEGWSWDRDQVGLFCRDADGVDFHPSWNSDPSMEYILECHAQNKNRRMAEIADKEFRDRALREGEYVTLQDSRLAGNCVEGSLIFAERNLGIPREEVISGEWFCQIPAKTVLRFGDRRAEAAVVQAYRRETEVSI